MNRNTTNYKISDKNVSYKMNSAIHENYWFQDLGNTIFNLDKALIIFPNSDMTYAEKINTLVRLSIYIGLILCLFYKNYLFLYIYVFLYDENDILKLSSYLLMIENNLTLSVVS